MKQLVVGLIATLATGAAFAQQPTVLAHAKAEGVTVAGTAVPAASSKGAAPGDVVTVASGEARVTFANGCIITVTPASTYTVPAQPPVCASPSKAAATDAKYYWIAGAAAVVAVGLASGGGGDGGGDKPSSP